MEFTAESRERCAAHGIDAEHSYRAMLLDIRMGGPVFQRLTHEVVLGLARSNSYDYEDTLSTLGRPSAPERLTRAGARALSRGEVRALEAAAAGLQLPAAAAHLGLSPHTVSFQLKTARWKLLARNTTHAVALAIRAGTIQPPARQGSGGAPVIRGDTA